MKDIESFQILFSEFTNIPKNQFHPLVWILGEPDFGKNVYIGGFSEINAKGSKITIGDNCDIASFVSINCSDSHRKCLGLVSQIDKREIILENNVFVGSHVVIKGGAHIGHHCVIGAGTIVDAGYYEPFSLIVGNPCTIKCGYYLKTNSSTIT